VQWVETTGRTVEDAKEAALDQLGIDESEAEFEVLDEPKTGLFGRPRGEARIRARVVPKAPRPKQERRPRRGRSRGSDEAPPSPSGTGGDDPASPAPSSKRGNERSKSAGGRPTPNKNKTAPQQEGKQMTDEEVPVGDQADIITEFLEGLLASIGAEGSVGRNQLDDETIELSVDGDDLGLLIGPKGQTLTAVHELSRTVLQRRATGRHVGRVRIDIGGYRHRRQEALARFVHQQAEIALESGSARALEPMNSADRKVVHDTVNEIDGVHTISEGADPHRRVVIVPEGASA
jgi:spoIIIJ-associated protein